FSWRAVAVYTMRTLSIFYLVVRGNFCIAADLNLLRIFRSFRDKFDSSPIANRENPAAEWSGPVKAHGYVAFSAALTEQVSSP
ncbi:MAG: hypothetical protein OXN84_19085, partial [Albidovulum sp.]|nr:hypothetical protein [Albidovulum sp.]